LDTIKKDNHTRGHIAPIGFLLVTLSNGFFVFLCSLQGIRLPFYVYCKSLVSDFTPHAFFMALEKLGTDVWVIL